MEKLDIDRIKFNKIVELALKEWQDADPVTLEDSKAKQAYFFVSALIRVLKENGIEPNFEVNRDKICQLTKKR